MEDVLLNMKQLLPVKEGERGLRQSDAVFHHVRALSDAAAQLREKLAEYPEYEIAAIGVSRTPRDVQGSYMPCFLAGVSAAEMLGAALHVPVFGFSHQAGHIMAAMHGANAFHLIDGPFAAFHVSGGTTDVLYVTPHEDYVFGVETVGGTADINAGQAIDRVGVHMGLQFPAGREMESLARQCTDRVPADRISVNGMVCNLSGLENKAVRYYESTRDRSRTSLYVLNFIGRTLRGLRDGVRETYGDIPILYAGGVMSCAYLKNMLTEENAWFSSPLFSSDNAVGTALLARLKFEKML